MMNEFAKFSARIDEVSLKMLRSLDGEKYTTPEVLSGIGLMLAATIKTVPHQKKMIIDFLKFLPEQLDALDVSTSNKNEVN